MKHGSPHTYDHLGCRCEECSDAARAYRRKAWEQRGRQHGLAGAFVGCRCEECRSARNAYVRTRAKVANGVSLEGATKTRQRWTLADIQIATERASDGRYVRSVADAAARLGRSRHSILRMRNRCLHENVGNLT